MMNSNDLPLLLSVEQGASAIGLSRTVLYARLMSGDIASVKEGKRRLIPRDALRDYVDRLLAEQAESPDQRKQDASKEAVTT